MKTQPLLKEHTQPFDETATQPLLASAIAGEAETENPNTDEIKAPRRSIREIIEDLRRANAEVQP